MSNRIRIIGLWFFALIVGTSLVSCEKAALNDDQNGGKDQNGAGQYAGLTREQLREQLPPCDNDSMVLVYLYCLTNGGNWWKNEGWLIDPLEYWKGVAVEDIDGEKRVVALRLGAFNLEGEIPEELGLLSELRALNLQWNQRLEGSIPEELFDLKKLEVLNLRMTAITGELSPKIGQLTELDTLNLATFSFAQGVYPYVRNKVIIRGELPKEIGQLKKLRYLDLDHQGFSGELPEEIGECTSLEEMHIELCRFSGSLPESMAKLKKLRNLSASYNKLSGEFPQWIGELPLLERLWFKGNKSTGSIPASITKLEHLWEIEMRYNELEGELPEGFLNMPSLTGVSLSHNKLTGDIAKVLEPLKDRVGHFTDIDLSYNEFTGNIPEWKIDSTQLILNYNKLTGTMPEYLMDEKYAGRLYYLVPQQNGPGFDNVTDAMVQDLIARFKPVSDSEKLHIPDFDKGECVDID